MFKGFGGETLARLFDRLTRRKPIPPPPELQDETLDALEKSFGVTDNVNLGQFLNAFCAVADAESEKAGSAEFSVVSPLFYRSSMTLFQQLADGTTTFHHPKPGTIPYEQENMFYAVDCYVPAGSVLKAIKEYRDAGLPRNANYSLAALKAVAEAGKLRSARDVLDNGYAFDSGVHSKDKYEMCNFDENGRTFVVLRRLPEGMKKLSGYHPS